MSQRLITIKHPRYCRGEPFQVEENIKYGIVIKATRDI